MARRTAKKTTTKPRKGGLNPSGEGATPSPAVPEKPAGGVSFVKFFILIVLVLLVLDGASFLKNGFQFKTKYFQLKKIAQFRGIETTGKSLSLSDIISVAPHELAVVDTTGNQVLVYDFSGKLIRKWGKFGKGPLEFQEPSGVTSDHQGHLFVMDTWNGVIKGFDLNGKPYQTIDLNHFQSFYGPRNVAWGGNCFIVSDASNNRIVRLSLAGDKLSVWQGKGSRKGEFSGAWSTIVDGKGHYYVCDVNENNRIQVFDELGNVIQVIKADGRPNDIAFDTKGRLFVGSADSPSKVFDAKGKLIGLLGEEAHPEQPITQILGIDITSDDMVLTCGGDLVTIYQIVGEKEK